MSKQSRRNDIARMTVAEEAIHKAKNRVEEMGADPTLTEALTHLQEAKELVSNFVDKNE